MTGQRLPRVAPFRALRYDEKRVGPLGSVLAPPYDVITPDEAAALRARHEKNIVRITLPEGEGDDRYAAASRALSAWIDEGTLFRDPEAAVYVHRHRFRQGGDVRARTGIWALLRLVPFQAGIVLPHERTMKGPKADRLALMTACRAHLSPIFFIGSDPDGRIDALVSEASSGDPGQTAEFPGGETHEVWQLSEPGMLGDLVERLGDQVFLIADGHHRYETALAYRQTLIEAGAPESGPGAHHYVLAYVVSERDRGLSLEPTHRVMATDGAVDWQGALEAARDGFRVEPIAESELRDPDALLSDRAGTASFILVVRGSEGGWLLEPGDASMDIPSVALHERFLRRVSGWPSGGSEGAVTFRRRAAEAVREVRAGGAEAAALLAPSAVAQIREAARSGRRLPPKTTYFQPKVPTGLAFHRVIPEETIGLP